MHSIISANLPRVWKTQSENFDLVHLSSSLHNLRTMIMVYVNVLHNNCSAIEYVPFLVWSCMWVMTGEQQAQHICRYIFSKYATCSRSDTSFGTNTYQYKCVSCYANDLSMCVLYACHKFACICYIFLNLPGVFEDWSCHRKIGPWNNWSPGPKFLRKTGPRVYVLGFRV